MSDTIEKPSGFGFWISAVIMIVGFLLFVFILNLFYVDGRDVAATVPTALTAEQRAELNLPTPEERAARLSELNAGVAEAATTYGWVDKDNGVVRLPIDRAIELVVQENQPASQNP